MGWHVCGPAPLESKSGSFFSGKYSVECSYTFISVLKVYSFSQCYELNVTSVQVNENCELKDSIILLISLQIILFFLSNSL